MKKVLVDESKCIRCGACMQIASDVFGYGSDGESVPLVPTVEDDNVDAIAAKEGCPTGAISLEDEKACKCEHCDCDDCECGEECDCDDCECEHCDCGSCDCE